MELSIADQRALAFFVFCIAMIFMLVSLLDDEDFD